MKKGTITKGKPTPDKNSSTKEISTHGGSRENESEACSVFILHTMTQNVKKLLFFTMIYTLYTLIISTVVI